MIGPALRIIIHALIKFHSSAIQYQLGTLLPGEHGGQGTRPGLSPRLRGSPLPRLRGRGGGHSLARAHHYALRGMNTVHKIRPENKTTELHNHLEGPLLLSSLATSYSGCDLSPVLLSCSLTPSCSGQARKQYYAIQCFRMGTVYILTSHS